jgi:peptidoglycan/LPS O-acetylase OafA/YrhL
VLLSGAATLALAILSWHLIEQRALALKPGITARSLAWLGRA